MSFEELKEYYTTDLTKVRQTPQQFSRCRRSRSPFDPQRLNHVSLLFDVACVQGLTSAQYDAALLKYGPNALTPKKMMPGW